MFWSEIESGFGEQGDIPHHEFRGVPSPPGKIVLNPVMLLLPQQLLKSISAEPLRTTWRKLEDM